MIKNIRQTRDRINAEFTRLGILGNATTNPFGIRVKATLTTISIHNYHSEPYAVWAKNPEVIIAALEKCEVPTLVDQAWTLIEATDVTPHELTVADVLGWDID